MSGGTEWEQGKAVSGMVEAIRASDPDAMALAMADYAAALGTRTTSILSGIVAPVMQELHAMRTERETALRSIDTKLGLLIEANERVALATLAHEVGGAERQYLVDLVRTIPDLTARVERLEARERGHSAP